MNDMYKDIERIMKTTNGNHFGFEGMTITEMAQYTEYPEGGFYDWHVDNDVNMAHEPPVRKISMTCLLSPETEFEGGDYVVYKNKEDKKPNVFKPFYQSMIISNCLRPHEVTKIVSGVRISLVFFLCSHDGNNKRAKN